MWVFVIGARGWPGVEGGIERHCEELYGRLVASGEVEVTAFVIKGARGTGGTVQAGNANGAVKYRPIRTFSVKGLEKLYYGLVATLISIIKRPDVVHYQGLNSALYVPLLRLFAVKVITTVHSLDYNYPKWGPAGRTLWKLSEKGALFSNTIIAVSDQIMEHLRKRHKRVVHLPNGAPLCGDIDEGTRRKVLKSFTLEPGRYVFSASRITPEKSLETLIEAFASIKNRDFKLVLAGESEKGGPYVEKIKKLASACDDIVLTGFQTGASLDALFGSAGLFCLPSTHEGMPMVLLEALSWDIEVVVSDIGANRQIELPEENFFPPGDAGALAVKLKEFMGREVDGAERERRRRFLHDRYNWDALAESTMKIYSNLTGINTTYAPDKP